MNQELRSLWSKKLSLNWKFGLFLILIVCVPRFILVLHANVSGSYGLIGIVMFISVLIPFIFLNRKGQKEAGIKKTKRYWWLFIAFVTGVIASFALYYIGLVLYGNTYENWYVYIAKSYNIPAGINAGDRKILFLIMAITGMTFSPIGEELFFRGIVHSSFAKSVGESKASVIDSTAFAVTHISHFGLVYVNQQWNFFAIPALIWVAAMFLVSILFFLFKKHTQSVAGAIFCHAGFNLGMIYCIFYLLS